MYCINSSAYAPSTKKMWRQALPNRSISTYISTQFDCFPHLIAFSPAACSSRSSNELIQQQSIKRKEKKKSTRKEPEPPFCLFCKIFFLSFFLVNFFASLFAVVCHCKAFALSIKWCMQKKKRTHKNDIVESLLRVCI